MSVKPTEESQSDALQALFDEAVSLQRQEDHQGAINNFQKILEQTPDHPLILNHYAISLSELGDLGLAEKALEKATQSAPDFADGWHNLGLVQQKNNDLEAAANSFNQIRTILPNSPVGHLKFAEACLKSERYEESFEAYKQALDIDPSNPAMWRNLSWVSLFVGDWDMALKSADNALQTLKGHTPLLAFKSIALLEAGKLEEQARLVDFDRLIETKDFSPPADFADLNSFNDALNSHCLNHPNLTFEPGGKSTTKGHQTSGFHEDTNLGSIAFLLELINEAVRDYQKSHPIDAFHPFLSQQPEKWSIDIWGTILGSQGHQASHVHNAGWLSGVYYSKIPDIVTKESDSQGGWIEFGRPYEYPKAVAEPIVRACQPHEGMVVLFPSYFYHRTLPFESKEQRISIAFDIVPLG
jgi:uncharacterized protein (TIGR02466 family)